MYDYSNFHEGPSDETLERLTTLVDEQVELEKQKFKLEAELEIINNKLMQISSRDIPSLMEEFPQTRFELPDCRVVEITETVRASISKQNQKVAHDFIREQGAGDIIKNKFTITFGQKDGKLAEKFEGDLRRRKVKIAYRKEPDVHHQSLGAFVRNCLAKGIDIPKVEFNLFRQKETKIT